MGVEQISRFPFGFVRCWPVCELRVVTPGVTLRFPDLADMAAIGEAAGVGVYDPADPRPVGVWANASPQERERGALTHIWSLLGAWDAGDWDLPLAVVPHGEDVPVGLQVIYAKDFGVCRVASTGSWLRRDRHREGIGTEMRAAVLHLAFAGLGAGQARSGAHVDNPASLGVSRRLGYEPDGTVVMARDGQPLTGTRLVLSRDRWERSRRGDIRVEGLGGEALDMFGVGAGDQR